ncbi:MAG: class I SAM-dependent methyltransferase [FCB group bacterium]|jgi:SAM-dependent methyltransferase|nr:class I SAM-dependent methyltransferase [FCB group bacterium]
MKGSVKMSFNTAYSHPFDIERVEEVFCNFCGETAFRLLGTELAFEIRECPKCGLVYISPQPAREELGKFYQNMYLAPPETVVSKEAGFVEKHTASIVKRRKPQPGRLLEIGCGYGGFLSQMEGTGWELNGMDLSEKVIEYTRTRVPSANVQCLGIDDADFPDNRFDCIVMLAVLEHVKDPRETLQKITRWLAPGGLIIVLVPYIAAYIRLKRWLPNLPVNFEAPRHLFDFTPKTLTGYLEEAGCKDVALDIGRPYFAPGLISLSIIWAVKLVGIAFHALTGGRYIWPLSSAFAAHAIKKS